MSKHIAKTKRNTSVGRRPVWQLVIMDLLLTGLVLCIFALFHHVIPRIRDMRGGPAVPISTVTGQAKGEENVPEREPESGTEPEPAQEPTPDASAPEQPEEEVPEEDPDDWGVKFAEHFSDEIVATDRSYSSPNFSVTIEEFSIDYTSESGDTWPLNYFVADIYVKDIRCLRAALPTTGMFARAEVIAEDNDAVFAVNGDFAVGRWVGLSVRNGDVYSLGTTSSDICALFYDGTVELYGPGEYDQDELLGREPYQIWQFGPSLLDEAGNPKETFNTTTFLATRHPRTAFGYYEPGHYCFLVADGRSTKYSLGLTMEGLARMMADLGCTKAFNLDGGSSSQLILHGEMLNQPCSFRTLKDMIILREPEETEPEEPGTGELVEPEETEAVE